MADPMAPVAGPQALYAQAAAAVVRAIRDQTHITDEELEALVAAEPDAVARKKLVSGLYLCMVIAPDQAALQVMMRPELKWA